MNNIKTKEIKIKIKIENIEKIDINQMMWCDPNPNPDHIARRREEETDDIR